MSHTIALVDDDRNILTSISMALENEGFKVMGLSDITNNFFLKKGIYGRKKIPKNDKLIINKHLKQTLLWTRKDLGQSVIASKQNILLKVDE